MTRASGPDISFYQDNDDNPGTIDFEKMKALSDFVIIRAGQNTWHDPKFKLFWKNSKKAGLARGSYWFYDSRSKPKDQAKLWRDVLGDDRGELPLCADFEERYGGPYEGWEKWYSFLEYLKQYMPEKEIVVYTNYYYWKENAPNPNTQPDSLEYFHQYPLWVARYQASKPLVPAPWGEDEWTFWQYTEHGDGPAYGVESLGIDLNYFNGTPEEFIDRFDIKPSPSVPVTYKVNLSLHAEPNKESEVLGIMAHDELLEKLESGSEGDWLKVKREDEQEGWISTQYLIKQEVPDPPDPPDPDPEKNWGVVLPPAGLNVREGPGTHFGILGKLQKDTVVKVLKFNDDESWVKIFDEDDNLTGWCGSRYFTFSEKKPDDPAPPDPPPAEDKWYRITVSALNVREGDSTVNEIIGKLYYNEIVEKLAENENGSWFKIRNKNDLVGWVYATYLEETDTPDPDPDPDPDGNLLGRYQVTINSLRVRKEPNTSGDVLGAVSKDDILWVEDATEAGDWQKIIKDDLVGWCSAKYLTRYPQRKEVNQKYFRGAVRYIREVYETPRKMIAHIFVIDMRKKLEFLVTPPDHNNDAAPICARTTTEFMARDGVHIAINGDGYQFANVPGLSCPEGSHLLNPNSYSASRGNIYSQRMNNDRPIMYINQKNEVTYNKPKGKIYNAISGDRTLVKNGKAFPGLDNTTLQPRSAVGTNNNGRWMVMIVIDGRQPGYSEGATLKELADMLIKHAGVYNAINLDGGGSSALAIKKNGKPFLLNSPIEDGIGGTQRKVANHLGVRIK